MGIRAEKQRYVSIIQLHAKSKGFKPEEVARLVAMVRSCKTDEALAQVKTAIWDVLGDKPPDTATRLLVEDLFERAEEPEDPPALREALARSQVNLKDYR